MNTIVEICRAILTCVPCYRYERVYASWPALPHITYIAIKAMAVEITQCSFFKLGLVRGVQPALLLWQYRGGNWAMALLCSIEKRLARNEIAKGIGREDKHLNVK